ncbi:MAG: SH3 domain-containing protein [Anaerolineae bacterium]|jgi:uncharacterized protein YraI|nr:SH3 domain-containing protein [Anaerolineae bacterium]
MKTKFAVSLLALFMLMSAALTPVKAQEPNQVWAFYMGFWIGGRWYAAPEVMTDQPQSGYYDQRDAGTVGGQIDQAKSAGIDAFIVSWYGSNNGETTAVLNNVLDRAGERGFRAAAALDIFGGGQTKDTISASVSYIINDRANHGAYLRYEGKPVIFFVFQGNAGLSRQDWIDLRNNLDPNRNTIWIAEGISGCCIYGGAMDGMYAFNISWSNGSASRYTAERNSVLNAGGSLYIPMVHPGWDETLVARRDGRPNPSPVKNRADGQFLTNSFNGAVASGANIIMIGTWNEYVENSHIEPSTTYGTQSLDTLRPLIADFKGQAPAAQPGQPADSTGGGAASVTVRTVVNVRTGAGTTFDIIGKAAAGSSYPLLGQEGDWYRIDFNGTPGFVSASFSSVSTGGSAPSQSFAPGTQVVVANTRINVRATPSTTGAIIGKLDRGQALRYIGTDGTWYIVDFNGTQAFVAAGFSNLQTR